MATGDAITCWEALDPSDPALARARHLYETTQAAPERIPWAWIAGAVADRHAWRPGHWAPHLLLAAPRSAADDADSVVGFAYGIHVPDYGGYVSYLGVDPHRRRQGAGTRLLRLMTCVLRVDAACEGVPLPFVVFESRRPDPGAGAEEMNLWRARVALFARAGAWWVEGLTFFAPNFARRQGPPVPLQLFLIPVETPVGEFVAAALRDVAAGLLREVYGRREGDALFGRTSPPGCRPALAPATEALSES
jgi:GNAT superfamily N-acetyltransferase